MVIINANEDLTRSKTLRTKLPENPKLSVQSFLKTTGPKIPGRVMSWFTKRIAKTEAYSHEEFLEDFTNHYDTVEEKKPSLEFGKTQVELKNPASDVENVYMALTRANNSLFLQRAITDKLETKVKELTEANERLEMKICQTNDHWKCQLAVLEENHVKEMTKFNREEIKAQAHQLHYDSIESNTCLELKIQQLERELRRRDSFIEAQLKRVQQLNIK